MKDQIIKPGEQAEAIRLAKVATGPAIGESEFWQGFVKHLDAIEKGSATVQPRRKRQD